MDTQQAITQADRATVEKRNRRGWTPAEVATLATPHRVARVTYYAWKDNPEECMRNGSFLRQARPGGPVAKYTLGDFQGYYAAVPPEYIRFPLERALDLIP